MAHGVRAQLRTGNLLTGAVFVAFDYFPGAPPATVDWSQRPVRLPTIPGQLEATEAKRRRISSTSSTRCRSSRSATICTRRSPISIRRCDREHHAVSATRHPGERAWHARQYQQPDRAEFRAESSNWSSTLQEVSRAARSMRVLADYLERHPEALLRGKKGEAK